MIDWDDAFDNSGYVPEASEIGAAWVAAAEAFRTKQPYAVLDHPYGSGDRERFDLFLPEGLPKGVVVFVHGGYWHMRAKSDWSHFSKGFLNHGWAVAIVGYTLAPTVRISQITQSIAAAVAEVAKTVEGPLRLVGHSAGGHLVSRMMCQGVLSDGLIARVQRVVSVSGVHDLRPLVGTRMNDTLGLTKAEALAESSALLEPADVPVTFWVGADERPEFLRQNRLIAEGWGLKGADVSTVYQPAENHFTVINGLVDENSKLVCEVLR
ncbi:alpha/beta hydrolase fold [Cognatiyoonia sediminum]|uniref:Alpha/beta hydrolase fold n=1 Tax=Cognatiyoonia sediminum TaxID=1508389 RepID=A0A1M5T2X8_9RHOB|nr:alpha/beta hydrolase [Cognatiyoonia sediminum]SHH45144.1 alpha/beta hydrolase fold [Cognatiyoonia sediminum]